MLESLPGDIFEAGQVLNNTYEIEGVLGRGGTGEVYRAKNLIGGRVVALKALNARLSGNDDYVGLMRREEQMRDIIHDAVVRYSDCSRTDDGHIYLVMDFVDGPALSDLLERGGMQARDLLVVAHRVAEGLAATHKRSVVHRDLSPDNIILRGGNPEEAVIIDFGIAKDNSAGAKTVVGNTFAGKYEYAAPEQLDGRAEPKSDLYALGATLLAVYRGDPPFSGASPAEIIRSKQYPLETEGVPEPLREIIEWLSEPSAEMRPQNAEEVVARLEDIMDLGAAKPKAGSPAKRKTRAGRTIVMALAAVAALAVGTLVYLRTVSLPDVQPYTLSAAIDPDGIATLSGHAPDDDARNRLLSAFQNASGMTAGADDLLLATGAPIEDWASQVSDIMQTLSAFEDWSLELSDQKVHISGVAPDQQTGSEVEAKLNEIASRADLRLTTDLKIGPRQLYPQTLKSGLSEISDCGPLSLRAPLEGSYFKLGETLVITGQVAEKETQTRGLSALQGLSGARDIRWETVQLNPELCKVRQAIASAGHDQMFIWLGYGDTGAANLTGIFHVGDNPVAEVHLPSEISTGTLSVFLVDNTDNVYHLLPLRERPEAQVAALGTLDGGLRRVRVLHSIDEFKADNSVFAIRMSGELVGKSEIYAIHTDQPVFEGREPVEPVDVFAAYLSELSAAGQIKGMTRRILDGRE